MTQENQWTKTPDCTPTPEPTPDPRFVITMRLRDLCITMSLQSPAHQDEIGQLFKRLIEINEHDDFMMGK